MNLQKKIQIKTCFLFFSNIINTNSSVIGFELAIHKTNIKNVQVYKIKTITFLTTVQFNPIFKYRDFKMTLVTRHWVKKIKTVFYQKILKQLCVYLYNF